MKGKEIAEKKISYYEKASSIVPCGAVTVREWLDMGDRSKIDVLRDIFRSEGKSDSYCRFKKDKLRCSSVSGLFSERKTEGLIARTNIIALDIDHVTNVEVLKDLVFELPYVYSCCLSCGGDGFFVLIPYKDGLNQKLVFNSLKAEFKEKFMIELDNCPDLPRARFESYDRRLLVKDDDADVEEYSKELDIEEECKSAYVRSERLDDLLNDDMFCYAAAYYAINQFGYSTNTLNNMHDWIGQVSTLSTLGSDGLKLALDLSRKSSGYISDDEVIKLFNKFSKKNGDSRRYMTRYFNVCKNHLGKGWIYKIKETYRKQNKLF